jgi:hypothetical protein
MLTIYKPGQVPVKGLRTSLKGAQLGDGYFQAIDNLRWDNGVLTVRDGTAVVSISAPGTVCLGAWSGALNGTYYVVSAWAVGGKTAIYTLDLATGNFTQLTSAGGAPAASWGGTSSGRTTFDSTTSSINFCVHTVGRRVVGPTTVPPVDVLSISNLEEYPLIWNPKAASGPTLVQHRNIRIPAGGTQFDAVARLAAHLQVATNAGTKGTGGSTPVHYKFGDTAAAPYNTAGNVCALLTVNTSAAAGDTATITFPASDALPGEQVNFLVEGTTPNVFDAFNNVKIDISPDNANFYTIYDSSSTDPVLAFSPLVTAFDTGQNRSIVTYSMKNIAAANRTAKYVRFTRKGASPAFNYTLTILAIASTGAGGGFPGDTEFQIAYSDIYSFAESGKVIGTNRDGDLLANTGGPQVVTSGSSSAQGTRIPVTNGVLYDYALHIKNSDDGVQISGGLNGTPTHVDIYFRTLEEAQADNDAFYWNSAPLYHPEVVGGSHDWLMVSDWASGGSAIPVITVETWAHGWASTGFALTDRYLRDPGVAAPSDFNSAMPRAKAIWTANQRSFAGAIRDTSDNYCYGDLSFSALGFPFRFTTVQLSETDGSRLTFSGEKVQAGVMASAGANGASIIYVLTDQSFNALGTAGGFVGSGYNATSLSTRVRINGHGTNEPSSVAERAAAIFYIDQEGQVFRFEHSSAASLSRHAVDDKPKGIPITQRGKTCAAIWKDRYYLAYTAQAGSANSRVLAWNEVLREWEFDDSLPSPVVAQRIVRCFDASLVGSGQRLLVFSSDGKVYAYEEGSTDAGASRIAIHLRSREFQTADLNLFRFGSAQMMVDVDSTTLNVDCTYKPRGSTYRGSVDCSDAEGKPLAIKRDNRVRTELTATGMPEAGWSGYLDVNGSLSSGKVLWRLESDLELLSRGAGER